MIDNRRVVAVVPARGGSKGVPGKNLREVAGVSLLHRALQTATACNYVDAVVVSSDDDAILQHAGLVPGVLTLLRPSELATDASSMAPVVDHVLSIHDADIVVLLQPTSPLREVHDIKGGLERFVAAGGGRRTLSPRHAGPRCRCRCGFLWGASHALWPALCD